jgi:ubiquinol-cytochrome c reductase cytochrome b subunit
MKMTCRERFNKEPCMAFADSHLLNYPTPNNLSYNWSFGSLAGFALLIQIFSGIFLAMHYTPHTSLAFDSVEHIMRDVPHGWLLRYLHSTGASLFFMVAYFHMFRGLYFGSYMRPRGFIWCTGVIIFLIMIITAFLGYVLPWGQMSFWGATVITTLCSAIPYVGYYIVEWLWGGFSVDNATLNRFFSLHYLFPFIIVGIILAHLGVLHTAGSGNPMGANTNLDSISLSPYFYVKDVLAFLVFFLVFSAFLFYNPNILGHSDNYLNANGLVTPTHIVPEWYLLPYYAILRAVPNKLLGVISMLLAILVLLTLPYSNVSTVRCASYRPFYRIFYWFLVADFLILGWVGQMPVTYPYNQIGAYAANFYFQLLLFLMPFSGDVEEMILRYRREEYIAVRAERRLNNLCRDQVKKAIKPSTNEEQFSYGVFLKQSGSDIRIEQLYYEFIHKLVMSTNTIESNNSKDIVVRDPLSFIGSVRPGDFIEADLILLMDKEVRDFPIDKLNTEIFEFFYQELLTNFPFYMDEKKSVTVSRSAPY